MFESVIDWFKRKNEDNFDNNIDLSKLLDQKKDLESKIYKLGIELNDLNLVYAPEELKNRKKNIINNRLKEYNNGLLKIKDKERLFKILG